MTSMIYSRGYGSVNVYAATIKNALSIFESHVQDFPYSEVKENEKVISSKQLTLVLKEIMLCNIGQKLSHTQTFLHGKAKKNEADNRPEVFNSKELLAEVSLCLVRNNLTLESLDRSYLSADKDILQYLPTLSSVLEGKKAKYLTEDELDMLHEYNVITNNKWEDSIDESKNFKIIRFVLEFVQNYLVDRNDIQYGLAEYNETF